MKITKGSNEIVSNRNQKYALRKILFLVTKRIFDVVVSLISLPFAFLIVLIFGILIKLESPGTVLYGQERVGKNGKIFTIYKLRSMYPEAEENGPQWASRNDPRVTRVGRIMRNARIDEIPQVINILKGDMSIVGPRPERPFFVYEFTKENPNFVARLKIRPGLTGWAQVNGGYDLTAQEKLEQDLFYIKHQSIWLDLKIILKTIKIVFNSTGAR